MPSIYLDHAASTPCDPRVIEAMLPFFNESFGNASSPHQFGRQSRRAVEEARESTAAFINALPQEIIFTSGASESNNHAIAAALNVHPSKGRHIISSAIEHHSILQPLQELKSQGCDISVINPDEQGCISLDQIKSSISTTTVLICLAQANNEIGTIQKIQSLGAFCRKAGIYLLVDATQTVGHIPVDVKAMNCDFLSFSAHKFYGPQGIGGLYIRSGIKEFGLILGGDQERGRRAGTSNVPGIVGLGKAIVLSQVLREVEYQKEMVLRNRIIERVLSDVPEAYLNGHPIQRLPNNAHFSFEGIEGETLVSALDMAGFAVSMGSACTWGQLQPSHVLKAIGLSDSQALGSLRVTVGRWNTQDNIDDFLKVLKLKVQQLRQGR